MKLKAGPLILIFLWCWFMGITAISIGFGALFPSMNRIAKPFVCLRGQMELETETYRPYPGSTITTLKWYCVDDASASGSRRELGIFPISLYAGTIYGVLLFGAGFVFMQILFNRSPAQNGQSRLEKANAALEQAKQYRARAEEFREQAELFRARAEQSSDPIDIFRQHVADEPAPQDALERMRELKKLRDANLISEIEYEEKRKEILKSL